MWDYKLAQYEMATTMSPYFDIYSFLFVDDVLKKWRKPLPGERLSEGTALKLFGFPDSRVEINIAD